MKILKVLFLIILMAGIASASTSVTGRIGNLGTSGVSNSFVRFWLRGCNGNQPRVAGSFIIAPSQGGVFYFDLPADASGNVSGTLYSTRDASGNGNGQIECGGSLTAVWYGMQVSFAGKFGPETPVHAKFGGSLDVTNVTPLTSSPVSVAPTGDTTYCRIDAGNCGFTASPTAPTPTAGDNSTKLATTAFVPNLVAPGPIGTTTPNRGQFTTLNGIIHVGGNISSSDIGTQINTAYAALPSTGGAIIVDPNPSGGCYNFSVPIVMATVGKYPELSGAAPSSGTPSGGTSGGTCLNYVPTSGAAITLDYVPTSGPPAVQQHGLRDITLINNGCSTSNGCGGTAMGVQFGQTNWGASNAVFQNLAIIGFEFGYNNSNANNIPGITWINPLFQSNVAAITNGNNTNNIFLGGFFVGNVTAIQANNVNSGNGEYSLSDTMFAVNSGPLFDFTRNTLTATVTCTGCHFEDSIVGGSSFAHFVTGLVNFNIYGGVMETDQSTGTQDWFISIDAGGFLNIHGLYIVSGGRTLTQAFLLNGTARADVSVMNRTPILIPTVMGGTGAPLSQVTTMTTGNPVTTTLSATFAALADAPTITMPLARASFSNAYVTLGGNRTLNITNPVQGGNYVLEVFQDATGSRTLTPGTGCTWKLSNSNGSGTFPLTATPLAIDTIAFMYDGNRCIGAVQQGYDTP